MREVGKVLVGLTLGFVVVSRASAQAEATLGLTLDYASPQTNLFFIDPGFMDVSSANGIAGALANPASLALVKRGEVGIAAGLSRSARFPFEIALLEEGESPELPEGLSIPFNMKVVEKGGVDYLGGAYRLGPVVLGGTVQRGESYWLTPTLEGEVRKHFSYVIEDTLTHADFPEIPEADTIPVTWDIEGTGTFDFSSRGGGRASITPGFLGAGLAAGPVNIGAGLSLVRYSGDLDILLRASGVGEGLLGMVDTVASGWRIDVDVNGRVEADTILLDSFKGRMSGNQVALVLGLLGKLWFVDFGLGLERGFPFELSGSYENRMRYAMGYPQRMEIDTSGVMVDSIAREISGTATVRFWDLELDERADSDRGTFQFGNRVGTRLGIGLNLFALRLGLGGGFDIFQPERSNVGVYHVSAMGGLSLGKVALKGGFLTRWQYLQFEDIVAPFPPHTTLGFTTSVDISPLRLDLALRTSLLPAMLEGIESVQAGETINPFSALNLGAGLRYRF